MLEAVEAAGLLHRQVEEEMAAACSWPTAAHPQVSTAAQCLPLLS